MQAVLLHACGSVAVGVVPSGPQTRPLTLEGDSDGHRHHVAGVTAVTILPSRPRIRTGTTGRAGAGPFPTCELNQELLVAGTHEGRHRARHVIAPAMVSTRTCRSAAAWPRLQLSSYRHVAAPSLPLIGTAIVFGGSAKRLGCGAQTPASSTRRVWSLCHPGLVGPSVTVPVTVAEYVLHRPRTRVR
jgi:hypothetical protein